MDTMRELAVNLQLIMLRSASSLNRQRAQVPAKTKCVKLLNMQALRFEVEFAICAVKFHNIQFK